MKNKVWVLPRFCVTQSSQVIQRTMLIKIMFILKTTWNSWQYYLHIGFRHLLWELINILLVLFESHGWFLGHIEETLIQFVEAMLGTSSLILEWALLSCVFKVGCNFLWPECAIKVTVFRLIKFLIWTDLRLIKLVNLVLFLLKMLIGRIQRMRWDFWLVKVTETFVVILHTPHIMFPCLYWLLLV